MKEKILHTALDLFMKYGIRDMSIQRIIEPLGISTKTVYKYFRNKEDILEQVLALIQENRFNSFKAYKEERNAVSLLLDTWYFAVESGLNVNNKFFEDLAYYYPELNTRFEHELGEKIWEQFRIVISDGKRDGVFLTAIHPDIALEGISLFYNAITKSNKFDKIKIPKCNLFFHTIVPFIRGFCTSKGIEQLEEHLKSFNEYHINSIHKYAEFYN